MLKRSISILALGLCFAGGAGAVENIIPLEEIQPGMEGEWVTVMSGVERERFPIRVIGIAPNMRGPQRDIIICEAMDQINIVSGPVAGMSGSPVYIDGRLAGAYSLGYSWPKDQAIIGVTPIEDMLEVLEEDSSEAPVGGASGIGFMQGEGRSDQSVRSSSAPFGTAGGMVMQPVPLATAGFSAKTFEAFREQFAAVGLLPLQGAVTSGDAPVSGDLKPGSAVAGVLLRGDFSAAATGTVTYRDGDELLAFGHPFMGTGRTEIPMAPAEILTIVRTLPLSFKLSRVGEPIGTISQDRPTAIAGSVGEIPRMIDLSIRTSGADGQMREFHAEAVRDPALTPLLLATTAFEALFNTLEADREQTISINATLEAEGVEPIVLQQTATGLWGAQTFLVSFISNLQELLNSPFERIDLDSVTFDMRIQEGLRYAILDEVSLGRQRVQAGEDLPIFVRMRTYQGDPVARTLLVPIPENLRPGTRLELFVGDANAAAQLEQHRRSPARSVHDVAMRWSNEPDRGAVHVRLLSRDPTVRAPGAELPSVPGSVSSLLQSRSYLDRTLQLPRSIIWKDSIPVEGEFSGEIQVPIVVE